MKSSVIPAPETSKAARTFCPPVCFAHDNSCKSRLGRAVAFLASICRPATRPHSRRIFEQAHKLQAPVDLLTLSKVKPAVISVRVVDGGSQTEGLQQRRSSRLRNSSAVSNAGRPNGPKGCRAAVATIPHRSGLWLFISADGFAVTNNHVVEKAESVQVTTDDGKVHNAKVIGADPRTDLR